MLATYVNITNNIIVYYLGKYYLSLSLSLAPVSLRRITNTHTHTHTERERERERVTTAWKVTPKKLSTDSDESLGSMGSGMDSDDVPVKVLATRTAFRLNYVRFSIILYLVSH